MARKAKALNVKNKAAQPAAVAVMKKDFCRWVEQGGALYWAAAKIGRSIGTIARWRKDDPEFDLAVVESNNIVTDNLKMSAYIRAMRGISKGSDSLMMFLIKQRDPSYRENYEINARHLHAGAIGNPARVPAVVQAAVDALSIEMVKKMAENL